MDYEDFLCALKVDDAYVVDSKTGHHTIRKIRCYQENISPFYEYDFPIYEIILEIDI